MKTKRLIEVQAPAALLKLAEVEVEKEYLRSADVMKLFSISDSTLKNLRRSGELPCYRLGKTYLYKREEIEACMKKLTESDED